MDSITIREFHDGDEPFFVLGQPSRAGIANSLAESCRLCHATVYFSALGRGCIARGSIPVCRSCGEVAMQALAKKLGGGVIAVPRRTDHIANKGGNN